MFLIFLLMSNSVSSHLTCRQTEQLWFESGAILKSTSALKYFTVGLCVSIWAPGASAVHTLSRWCPKVFQSDIHHLWLCILPRFFLFFFAFIQSRDLNLWFLGACHRPSAGLSISHRPHGVAHGHTITQSCGFTHSSHTDEPAHDTGAARQARPKQLHHTLITSEDVRKKKNRWTRACF